MARTLTGEEIMKAVREAMEKQAAAAFDASKELKLMSGVMHRTYGVNLRPPTHVNCRCVLPDKCHMCAGAQEYFITTRRDTLKMVYQWFEVDSQGREDLLFTISDLVMVSLPRDELKALIEKNLREVYDFE